MCSFITRSLTAKLRMTLLWCYLLMITEWRAIGRWRHLRHMLHFFSSILYNVFRVCIERCLVSVFLTAYLSGFCYLLVARGDGVRGWHCNTWVESKYTALKSKHEEVLIMVMIYCNEVLLLFHSLIMHSVLWCCWLAVMKCIRLAQRCTWIS